MLNFILWLIIGGVAGMLAGKVMSGHGYGVVMDIVLGIVGAFVGGFIVHALFGTTPANLVMELVVAFIGACVIVGLLHMVRREPLRT